MKKVLFTIIFGMAAVYSHAQKELFDIVAYTPPKDSIGNSWKKELKENIIVYTITDKITQSWCQINIVKSTVSKGDIEQDFESEWKELVVKSYKTSTAPQLNEVQESEGWKIKAGGTQFISNNSTAMVLLTTASGYNRCASIVATTNNQGYIKDIEALLASVDLKKPAMNTQPTIVNNDDTNAITGTWLVSASNQSSWRMKNGVMDYIKRQYTFNADGTYTFISKAFDPLMDKILFGKETGTYQINGNSITVNPNKSVLQAWSKKDGADKWGKLINSQNAIIEKVTYQFFKHFSEGLKEWELVLQANNTTKRDGPFSAGTAFSNSWIYGSPCSQCLIVLPE